MTTPLFSRKNHHEPIDQLLAPIQEFIHAEASGGIVLMIATAIALVWANSPWADSYFALWDTHLGISIGGFELNESLQHWINDALMTVFFFVVGLEIKREVMVGELQSFKKAAMPIMAALGGMVIPALIYIILNIGKEGIHGWGIPMATDIAFALGILALVGKRAPLSLKIFLTALAIVDDIGAVLVIAVFYTEQIYWLYLGIGVVVLALMFLANWAGARHPLIYGVLGIVLWAAFLKSGVHATIAGILGAMAIPSRTRINPKLFLRSGQFLLTKFENACRPGETVLTNKIQRSAIQKLETICQRATSPMQRLEHTLHPWMAFVIVPVFALANAGVAIEGPIIKIISNPVVLGIFFGLLLGKQIGITLFSWLAVKSGLADMPDDLGWRHIYGVSWLASIGFTMSIFVSTLAFAGDPELLEAAKTGILFASIFAGVGGYILLSRMSPKGNGE